MKKVFHSQLHDWAVPKNLTEPVCVLMMHVHFSEIEEVVKNTLKDLIPFNGLYSLHVEFTEPNTDPRFVIGHIGCVISVHAESAELAKTMLEALR